MVKDFLKTHKLLIITFFIITIIPVGLYVNSTSIDLKGGTVKSFDTSTGNINEYKFNDTFA